MDYQVPSKTHVKGIKSVKFSDVVDCYIGVVKMLHLDL